MAIQMKATSAFVTGRVIGESAHLASRIRLVSASFKLALFAHIVYYRAFKREPQQSVVAAMRDQVSKTEMIR